MTSISITLRRAGQAPQLLNRRSSQTTSSILGETIHGQQLRPKCNLPSLRHLQTTWMTFLQIQLNPPRKEPTLMKRPQHLMTLLLRETRPQLARQFRLLKFRRRNLDTLQRPKIWIISRWPASNNSRNKLVLGAALQPTRTRWWEPTRLATMASLRAWWLFNNPRRFSSRDCRAEILLITSELNKISLRHSNNKPQTLTLTYSDSERNQKSQKACAYKALILS